MAFVSAKSAQFTLAGTDISSYTDTVGGVSNTTDMLETTTFGAGSKTFIGGLRNGDTISISGKYDSALHTVIAALLGSASTSAWVYGPAGTTTGNVKFTGNCLVSNYEIQAGVANVLTWSATLQISGAVTVTTY